MGLPSGTAADIVFAAIILLSGVLALYRGFVTEVLAIAGWAGAAIATVTLFNPLQPIAQKYIPSDIGADVATGIIIFFVALLSISILARIIASTVRGKSIGLIDRFLGLLFGLLRGYVVLVIVFLLFEQVYPLEDQPDWIRDAHTVPLLDFGGTILLRLVPISPFEDDLGFDRAGLSAATLSGDTDRIGDLLVPPIRRLTSPRPDAITAAIGPGSPADRVQQR